MPYRVLIVDDFLMSRQVFERAVKDSDEFTIAASLSTATEAVEYVSRKYVDLVIMDIVMTEGENGLEAARRIKDIRPETKILFVTSMPELSYIDRARSIGAESFWYKEVQEQPILEIMQRTMNGESVYPDSTPEVRLGNAVSTEFTDKEAEVLRELTGSLTNEEIAENLHISANTVKRHLQNIMEKTGFSSPRVRMNCRISSAMSS